MSTTAIISLALAAIYALLLAAVIWRVYRYETMVVHEEEQETADRLLAVRAREDLVYRPVGSRHWDERP